MYSCEDIKTQKRRECILAHEGKEVLACILELPRIDGNDKLNRMWDRVGENCIIFCRRKITHICDLQRFYVYKFVCRAAIEENKIVFNTRATLSDRTACRILHEEKRKFCLKLH